MIAFRPRHTFSVCPLLVVLVALTAAACGSSPVAPSPPPPPTPPAPHLVCPGDMSPTSPDGNPMAVSFSVNVQDGTGTAPVSVSCDPPSGTVFPPGTTTVQCKATDAQQRTDSCAFWVTVLPPPRLSVTRIVAFGNSITEGKPTGVTPYPTTLQILLSARYTAQHIAVINEGLGGEATTTGMSRFAAVLNSDNPDAVLLEEGVNDLNDFGASAESTVVANLREMIRAAKARGAKVFVSTLLPERPGSSRGTVPDLIAPTNDMLRPMVAAEGATLVDIWAAFGGTADPYIGPDGLHPNDAGYQKIAENFYNALQTRLEVAQSVFTRSHVVSPATAAMPSRSRR